MLATIYTAEEVVLQSLASFYSPRCNTFDYLLSPRSPLLSPQGDVSVGRRMNKVLGSSTERLNPCLRDIRGYGPAHRKPSSPCSEKETCALTHGIQLQLLKFGLQGASKTQHPIVTV